MSLQIPKELKYTEDHEWVKLDGDTAIVGITDHAQSELGDIIFIEFPEINDLFERMEPFGTIEAVKTVADLFSPLNGKIIEINKELEDSPELVNSDPYGKGWIVKVSVDKLDQLNDLLSSESYENHIG